MKTVADYASGHDNNFNLLRFGAATAVIYTHSYPLVLGLDESGHRRFGAEIIHGLTGFLDGGGLAVCVFFVISGFLVGKSLDRSRTLLDFGAARVLRIYPGLVVSILLTAFLLGPLFTSMGLADYFSSRTVYSFAVRNSTMLSLWLQSELPGVFTGNPIPRLVNGSLWTLPWELLMYVSLAVAGIIGVFRQRALMTAGILVLVIYYAYCQLDLVRVKNPDVLYGMLHFGSYFYLGTLIYLHRKWLPCNATVLLAAVAGFVAILCLLDPHPRLLPLLHFVMAYAVICLAFVTNRFLLSFNRLGDYSYGLYIYAFPVQQVLVVSNPCLQPMQLFGMAFVITLLVAMLSWHLVEKPALALKQRLRKPSPVQT